MSVSVNRSLASRNRAGAVAVLCVALSSTALAQWNSWEADFDDDRKPWKEIEAKLPPYPKAENLVPFEASAGNVHQFFIDAKSLSVDEDGVVRYTLVVKTAGGATNVTYEGIRCELRQQKYYAVGQANGNWTRARNPQWRRIEYQGVNNPHGVLHQDYFCSGLSRKQMPRSVKEVLQLLKYKPTLTTE